MLKKRIISAFTLIAVEDMKALRGFLRNIANRALIIK